MEDVDAELDFGRGLKFLIGKISKLFLHPSPPLKKVRFIAIVEFTIPKVAIL